MGQALAIVPVTTPSGPSHRGVSRDKAPAKPEAATLSVSRDSYKGQASKDLKTKVANIVAVSGLATGGAMFVNQLFLGRSSPAVAAICTIGPAALKVGFAGMKNAVPATKAIDQRVTNHVALHVPLTVAGKVIGGSWTGAIIWGGIWAVVSNFLSGTIEKEFERWVHN